MNERIKQLATQACFKNQDEESIGYFAELIVRECCDVAVKFHLAHPYSVEYQIKKHFGVEE